MSQEVESTKKIHSDHIFKIPVFIIRAILWVPAVFLVHFLLRMKVEGRENIEKPMTFLNKIKFRFLILFNFFTQAIVSRLLKIIFSLFIRIEVKGWKNLKRFENKSFILASNHLSDLDPLLLRIIFPIFSRYTPLMTVGRVHSTYEWKGWKNFLYMKWIFRFLGCYAAKSGNKDYSKSLDFFVKMGKLNQSIMIFIGGAQKNPDEKIKVKGGAGYLTWATGLHIVPITINGTYKVTSRYRLLKRPKVEIQLGKPYNKEELFVRKNPQIDDFLRASEVIISEIEKNIKKQ